MKPSKTIQDVSNELTWLEPVEKQTNVSEWHIWKTKCHRYEVIRSISKLCEGENYFAVMKITEQTNKKKIIRNNLRTLNASLLCAEHDLQELSGKDVLTNDMTTLVHAENLGLEKLPEISQGKGSKASENSRTNPNNVQCGAAKPNNEGITQVNLKESEARKLLTAVGFDSKAIEKCNVKRLMSKVNGLPSVHEELKQPEDLTDRAMLQSVLDALQEDTKITIVPDEAAESQPPAEESKEDKNMVVVTKRTVTTTTKTDSAGNKTVKRTSQPKVEKVLKTKPTKSTTDTVESMIGGKVTKIDMVKDALANDFTSPAAIIEHLKAKYGVEISYSMASNYKTVIKKGNDKKKADKIKYKVTDLGITMYEGHPSLTAKESSKSAKHQWASAVDTLKVAKQLIAAVGGVSQAKELVDLMA